jgi:thioredoxin 1
MMRIALILALLLLFSACTARTDTRSGEPADSLAADSTLVLTPLVTFIELGAETCIPCKMMQPVMKEIAEEYQGLVKVIFHDLYKDRQAGQRYKVRVMPTQVFLDAQGKEFFRHEGFYPKQDIEKMLLELAGLDKPRQHGHP